MNYKDEPGSKWTKKSKQELIQENKELRRMNSELESLLIESQRASEATTDLKTLVEVAQDLIELKRAQEELKQERDYFKNVLDNSADAIGIVDSKGRFIRWNKRAEELFGYSFQELKGKSAFDLYSDSLELEQMLSALRVNGYVRDYEISIKRKDGQVLPFGMSISVLKEGEKNIGSVCVARELTQIKQAQDILRKTNEELEKRVQERTIELTDANKKLEEANIALRVLLEKKDENKKAVEESMVYNVKQLIQPFLDKLKDLSTVQAQMDYLQIIEKHLGEIISPLNRNLSCKYSLSPTELQLVELIKQGKQTKEIADMMQVSKRTVDAHRHNIRKKMGILNKNVNMMTFLNSLDLED